MLENSGICLEQDLTVSELVKEVHEIVSEDESTSDEDEDVVMELFLFKQKLPRLRPLGKDKIETNLRFNSYEITFVSSRKYRR